MDSNYLQELIGIQRDDIASCKRRAIVLTTVGISILVFAGVTWLWVFKQTIGSNVAPALISTIGTFVGACGLLPYKDITPRRLELARVTELSREYERIKDLPEDERESRLSKINKVLREIQGTT